MPGEFSIRLDVMFNWIASPDYGRLRAMKMLWEVGCMAILKGANRN
jgi:hypothetical protein